MCRDGAGRGCAGARARPRADPPPLSSAVSNFSVRDASLVAGAGAASAPVGYLLGLPTRMPRPAMGAAAAIGLDPDIELESEDFNRRYRVSARQPKFASDVLTPRTMQALLARPATAMRIDGNVLIGWESGQLEPVGLLSRLATLHALVDGIPGFVWKDHGYDPGVGPSSVTPQPGGSAP